MGNLSVFQVELTSGKRVRVTQPNLIRSDEDAYAVNDTVMIGWDGAASVVVGS